MAVRAFATGTRKPAALARVEPCIPPRLSKLAARCASEYSTEAVCAAVRTGVSEAISTAVSAAVQYVRSHAERQADAAFMRQLGVLASAADRRDLVAARDEREKPTRFLERGRTDVVRSEPSGDTLAMRTSRKPRRRRRDGRTSAPPALGLRNPARDDGWALHGLAMPSAACADLPVSASASAATRSRLDAELVRVMRLSHRLAQHEPNARIALGLLSGLLRSSGARQAAFPPPASLSHGSYW